MASKKKLKKRPPGSRPGRPSPSASSLIGIIETEQHLRDEIRQLLAKGMSGEDTMEVVWEIIERDHLFQTRTRGMTPDQVKAFQEHVAYRLAELVREEESNVTASLSDRIRQSFHEELNKGLSYGDILKNVEAVVDKQFPNLDDGQRLRSMHSIKQILREEIAKRIKGSFHARLQEALGSPIEVTPRFLAAVQEELAVRDAASVQQSTEAFIRKTVKHHPAEGLEASLQAGLSQALISAPLTDDVQAVIDRNRIQMLAKLIGKPVQPALQKVYTAKPRGTPQEQSVECYLEALGYTLEVARQQTDPERRADAMQAWAALKEARVIHIGEDLYNIVYHTTDRYVVETLGGLDWQEYQDNSTKDQERHITNVALSEGKRQSYPDQLPFSAVFLGYGAGIREPVELLQLWAPQKIKDRIVMGWLLGHLLTETGLVLVIRKALVRTDYGDNVAGEALWIEPCRSAEMGWVRGYDLEPWILPHLVNIINEHRTFVIEHGMSKQQRRDIQKNHKALGLDYRHMPRPYYTLKVQSKIVEEVAKKTFSKPRQPMSYKTDVRGHERCRIRRGPLPLDLRLEQKLKERGYQIFAGNRLDEETYRRLNERGMAYKRADEWLAVKVSWIDAHYTCNDPKLPYIPAVRVLGSVKAQGKKFTGSWTEDPGSR